MRDKEIGKRCVLIAPDEDRTFGMDVVLPESLEHLQRRWVSRTRRWTATCCSYYKEAADRPDAARRHLRGRFARPRCIAASTAYATHGEALIPFYVFYSMFGWQRTADQFWQLGDQLGARLRRSARRPAVRP
ncbi:pyruvate dehydrogenase (acetyl-transferring), homodimeric type [Streptomyces tanashiensis]